MSGGEFAVALGTACLGFIFADGIDRLLATYNPSSTDAAPANKFTSNGAGTLANTLNVASRPGWMRIAAGVALPVLPAVGSMYVKSPMLRGSLEGFALGAAVSGFKTFWNNFLMPLLVPATADTPTLQKSYIARLYPAEVAARINMQAAPPGAVSSSGSGALSGAPQTGVAGPADVGPFALAGDSPYQDAAQALRAGAGVSGYQSFPSLQNTWGTGASAAGTALPTLDQATGQMGGSATGNTLPTAAQVLRHGVSAPAATGNPGQPGLSEDWQPGPPALPGAGPQARPHSDPACGCMGDGDQFLGFIGDQNSDEPLYDIPK